MDINPRMLTIPMVAKYLSATNWFVEELIRNKKLPAMKIGKRWTVDLRDLNEWIDEQTKIAKVLQNVRLITNDEEAQRFFEGIEQDPETGAYISNPDNDDGL